MSADNTSFAGSISGGDGGLVIQAAGNFTLFGSANYNGSTTVDSSATYIAGGINVFAANSQHQILGILDLNGFNQTIGSLAGNNSNALVSLGSGILFVGGDNTVATYQGLISGTGGLFVTGTGAVVLSGSAQYTGPTIIDVGATLQGGNPNSLAQTSIYTMLDQAKLIIGGDQTIGAVASTSNTSVINVGTSVLTTAGFGLSTLFAGEIIGTSGGLTKDGGGAFTLSGASNYTGPTNINKGTLILTGSLQSPATVASGAILGGTGLINNSVDVFGTIRPGTSIGTMHLGSLALESTATFDIEINPDINSKLVVTNAVSLDGTLRIRRDKGVYHQLQVYELIASGGTNTGEFANITGLPPIGYIYSVGYSSHSTVFFLRKKTPLCDGSSFTGNNKTLFSYFQGFYEGIASDFELIRFDLLLYLSCPELQKALEAISPARNQASTYFASENALMLAQASSNRLGEIRRMEQMRKINPILAADEIVQSKLLAATNLPAGTARTMAAGHETSAFWSAGFGSFMSQEKENQNPSLNDTASGGVLGWDYFGKLGNLSLSSAFIHNHIDENGNLGGGASNGVTLTALGDIYMSNFYLEVGALAGYNQFRMHRNIAFGGPIPFSGIAKSSFDVWQVMPHAEFGYDQAFHWGVLEPFASFDWVFNFQEDYKERGAGALDMLVQSSTPSTLAIEVGINVYEALGSNTYTFIFEQSVAYANQKPYATNMKGSLDIEPGAFLPGAPTSFALQTYNERLNLLDVGIEILYKHKPSGFFVETNYNGLFGSGFKSNTIIGTLGLYF